MNCTLRDLIGHQEYLLPELRARARSFSHAPNNLFHPLREGFAPRGDRELGADLEHGLAGGDAAAAKGEGA